MKAERIESSLQRRFWSLNRLSDLAERQVVLLTDGSGEAEAGEDRLSIEAPALLWLGDQQPGRLRVEAGSTGYRGHVANAVLVDAIGDQAESVDLRYLVDRNFVLSLAGQGEQASVIARCFNGVLNELRQPQEGSPLLLAALLRIMLVTMMRLSGAHETSLVGTGEKAGLLQRFRQLVEMNFRSHWSIVQYASALGISADRLHAVCTSGIGKSPKALVSERLAHEAALRLDRSAMTIQQLGHSLGFNDPAHFSNFFRRMMGISPGAYRRQRAEARRQGELAPPASFADWP
ncbi:AraC family transcriptional regulator [Aquibium sp. LZ166]|uniref:AraC family transcriptional regulator n=1 Tax=Aquibium pacificus TaxID=3153579 RepID=A0ABV3ST27_9HYPH